MAAFVNKLSAPKIAREQITSKFRITGIWRFNLGLLIIRLGAWVAGPKVEFIDGDGDDAAR